VKTKEQRTANRRLAKVAVQCSADTFVVNQTLVLRINICAQNRHLRQAPNRCASFYGDSADFNRCAKKSGNRQRISLLLHYDK